MSTQDRTRAGTSAPTRETDWAAFLTNPYTKDAFRDDDGGSMTRACLRLAYILEMPRPGELGPVESIAAEGVPVSSLQAAITAATDGRPGLVIREVTD